MLAVTFLAFVASALAGRARVAPVEKVLEMLNEMKAKGEQMLEAEKKTYATYGAWVDGRTTDLKFEIVTAKRKIDELAAFADKADNDVAQLTDAIGTLDGDIARLESERNDATDIRTKDHGVFLATQADFSESVDALEHAIQIVSKQAYDRPQAEVLLQQMSRTVPGMRKVLAAFLQQNEAGRIIAQGAPAVDAYEFQTGGVLSILERLLEKFKGELDALVTDESNTAHYYDLQMLHLTDTITKSSADRQEQAATKAAIAESSTKAKSELADTRASLAELEKFLSDMKATFQVKSASFQANQQVRVDELKAISQAIEIISSTAVADSYSNRVKLAQLGTSALAKVASASPPALLQTLRSGRSVSSSRQRAAELLGRRAGALASRELAKISAEVLASTPFAKVIQLIEDLLARLKEEAAAEATHKQWCDEQLKSNKLKREKKGAAVERLSAKVESLASDIGGMAKEIATLAAEKEKLTKSMADATTQRESEKKQNTEIIADAQAGKSAVKQALVILREFYEAQTAFLQIGHELRQVPELEKYTGMGGEKTGVIGMLEVIESDFARLEADTKAAEAQAGREYDAFMSDAKADRQQKHETEVKTSLAKDQTEFEKSQTMKELTLVDDELAQANKYYESLKPSCLQIHVSYEERAARRQEEIEALKEAYNILDQKTST